MTGYIVEKMDLTTNVWRRATTSTSTAVTVSCLEEHKEYKFRVLAENIVGISEPGPDSVVAMTRELMPDIDYDELCELLCLPGLPLCKVCEKLLREAINYIPLLFGN